MAVLRKLAPDLGSVHWKASVGQGDSAQELSAEGKEMLEAGRRCIRMRLPGWKGLAAQRKWPVQRLLNWARDELSTMRRKIEMEDYDEDREEERLKQEQAMGVSLRKWLGFDRPLRQRVRYVAWRSLMESKDHKRQLLFA